MGKLTIAKLFLLSGQDLPLTKHVVVRHPTVADILNMDGGIMCEDLYWAYVSTILSDPYDYMVYLDDRQIDYESVSAWDVFAMRWFDAKQIHLQNLDNAETSGMSPLTFMQKALECFFGARSFDIQIYDSQAYLVDLKDPSFVVNKEAFDLATEFVSEMHCIDTSGRIKPATPVAKQILIEDTRAEQKRKAKSRKEDERPEQIADALNTVFAGGAGTITPTNYMDIHIYQLLCTARAVQRQVVVQSMFNGIYTGMLKTDGLSDEELRWV